MLPPAAVLALASLAAAGFKVYTDMSSSPHLVQNALERYADARMHFYQIQNETMKGMTDFGHLKLHIWRDYARLSACFKKLKNTPTTIVYKESESFFAGKVQIEALATLARTATLLEENHWDEPGTGLLTALAIYAGTVTRRVTGDKVVETEGYPPTQPGESILDSIAPHQPPTHSKDGLMEESGALAEVAAVPEMFSNKDLLAKYVPADTAIDQLDKETAEKVKEEIDWQSLKVEESAAKVSRIASHVGYLMTDALRLSKKLNEEYEWLENLVQSKDDYLEFNEEEKDQYQYLILLARTLRLITRFDLLIKQKNVCILNTLDVHDVIQRAAKVLPPPDKEADRAVLG